jgi:hypothetical protein
MTDGRTDGQTVGRRGRPVYRGEHVHGKVDVGRLEHCGDREEFTGLDRRFDAEP